MGIESSDNYIDPEQVRVEADEYEDAIACKKEEIENAKTDMQDSASAEDYESAAEYQSELLNLEDELVGLEEEAQDIFDLRDDCDHYASGGSLINESVWEEYVQEMASDMGGVDLSMWPYNCIDWEKAAWSLRVDYTTITWRGVDFFVR